ncbi:MAG: hypothetical protein ACTHMX_09690 [Thermomicrobiales bacterium]
MAALRKSQTETITVPASTHARLQEIAREQARPMGEIVTDLVERYEDAQFWQAYTEALERLRKDPAAWQEYRDELHLFDGATGDALKDEEPYFTPEELEEIRAELAAAAQSG